MRVNPGNSKLRLIKNALELFASGRMFRDYGYLAQRLGIGAGATALLLVLLSFVVNSPVVLALVAGFLGGILQPFLFEDVRYK
jgi:hypothetical protein